MLFIPLLNTIFGFNIPLNSYNLILKYFSSFIGPRTKSQFLKFYELVSLYLKSSSKEKNLYLLCLASFFIYLSLPIWLLLFRGNGSQRQRCRISYDKRTFFALLANYESKRETERKKDFYSKVLAFPFIQCHPGARNEFPDLSGFYTFEKLASFFI